MSSKSILGSDSDRYMFVVRWLKVHLLSLFMAGILENKKADLSDHDL